jgi:hypothetical protein
VDFGAEESFDRALERVREHYGIEISYDRMRGQTLRHGKAMNGIKSPTPKGVAQTLITEIDGSMIPIVQSSDGNGDHRKGKQLSWREARLCLARHPDRVQPCYGATLASAQVAAMLWRQTAQSAGLGPDTHVHGVGDGAQWIINAFKEQFGAQGKYLLDFYHCSEYLAAAAPSMNSSDPKTWMHRQQGRLLENKLTPVLKSLSTKLEAQDAVEAPVRGAHRYLSQRADYLDYAGTRKAKLPIGSGEIESGHRHVIQQRLKLSGSWWKDQNAEAMLSLRVCRANQCWANYWTGQPGIEN